MCITKHQGYSRRGHCTAGSDMSHTWAHMVQLRQPSTHVFAQACRTDGIAISWWTCTLIESRCCSSKGSFRSITSRTLTDRQCSCIHQNLDVIPKVKLLVHSFTARTESAFFAILVAFCVFLLFCREPFLLVATII